MPTPTSASRPRVQRPVLWAGAVVALLLLVVFPLQTLAVAMLVATAMLVMSIYVVWRHGHRQPPGRNAAIEHRLPQVTGALTAFGAVAALLFPATVATVAFVLMVLAACALFVLELADRGHRGSHHRA